MRIFFLSYWFPYPPDNGSRIRVFNFIKALSTRHEVHLFSLLQRDSDPKYVETLKEYCRIVSLQPMPGPRKSLAASLWLFARRPRSIVTRFDPELYEKVQQAIRAVQPDVIIVSMVDLAEYITFGKPEIPCVLIDHNCEFGVIQRMANLATSAHSKLRYEMTWRKYADWEARILQQFDRVVMPNAEDKEKMQQFSPSVKNIAVIPNAADTDYYNPAFWSPKPRALIYNGALTYSPNFDAVLYYKENIYPILKEIYPDVQLLVTGRYDGINVDRLTDCPGIKLTGYVEDIRDVLYRSAACIIPVRQGGGMRLKIPEAMAAGVPVVSTGMGAEGLECVHGRHLLIADTADDFVTAICRVLEDKTLVETLRQNARQLVETKYSWKHNAGRFVELVESVSPNGNYIHA
jgi:glycosyltransferase involved in cell wall biosynthesis